MQLGRIRNVGVVGAGTMGYGIGLAYALGAYNVILHDEERVLDNALKRVKSQLDTFADCGLISEDSIERTMARITTTTKIEELAKHADLITEAVTEDVLVKREVFTSLDVLCPAHTVLASNTSSLILQDFTSQCNRKDRILTTHWFNPPAIIPVVEVVRGDLTSDEVIELICSLLRKINKVPVKLQKEIPGFLVDRIQIAMIREVWSLWQQGIASAEDIDLAIKGSIGLRLAAVGPLRICDLGGLDTWYKVAEHLLKLISSDREPPDAIKRMVNAGEVGFKAQKGFFNYIASPVDKVTDENIKTRDENLIQLLKALYPRQSSGWEVSMPEIPNPIP